MAGVRNFSIFDARAPLGPDWAKYVEPGVNTCM